MFKDMALEWITFGILLASTMGTLAFIAHVDILHHQHGGLYYD